MAISPREALAVVDYYMVGISKLPGFDKPIKLSPTGCYRITTNGSPNSVASSPALA